ncbi:MAG: sugar-binding protein [Verrucomicrobia bacterium]|nr:sugar-binding protein [Verrucomicrobiota bacterium]
MNNTNRLLLLSSAVLIAFAGCGKPTETGSSSSQTQSGASDANSEKPKLAYVTNGIDPFWNPAAAGARAAAKEFNAECEVLMPAKGIVDQNRIIETLLARGIDGIAISPIDAKNQVGVINEACERAHVITHDSDAPDSKRLCFVGMNNYSAGRAAGKLVKEAMPNGGKVMIFVGRLEQLNAQQRRQGVIDELIDRPVQSLSSITYDPPGKVLEGGAFTVLDTRTDNFDYARAKANAEDAITSQPDLGCMIGLFAYNAPMCKEAVKEAGKTKSIKIVSFDEQDSTLQGIIDGDIYGTVSQQPYLYGYHSVRILAALKRGDQSAVPKEGFHEVEIREVRKENVKEFWAELKKLHAP